MQTTLNKIKHHSPCKKSWGKLLNHLGKTQSDDEVLQLRTILESNGLDDTIWAMRAVQGKDKEIRLFAADCAELVLNIYERDYPDDNRPRLAIHAARDYANGLITREELTASSDAARDAARASSDAAWNAAWAASAAAWDAARDAARAASDAAWDAAWAASAAAWNAASAEIKQILLKYI
jgi:Immunity protein Imm5